MFNEIMTMGPQTDPCHYKKRKKPGMVVHTCPLSYLRGSQFQGQPGNLVETLSKGKNKEATGESRSARQLALHL